MSEVNDLGYQFFVNTDFMRDGIRAHEYIKHKLEDIEKEAIYRAVKQVNGWICINPVWHEDKEWDGVTHTLHIRCKPVRVERVYVASPAVMPPDVFECKWCGGYTHNDYLGHCAACGGPRDSSYIDKMRMRP